MRPLIVADESVPFARQAFGTLGRVRLVSGRRMGREDVREAELLIVRSVTRVDGALLDGSRVRFVGTATIGTEHVDLPELARRGIAFAAAPGCNANSVSEWVTAVLLETSAARALPLAGRTLGIVGAGNVGRRVEAKARALGMGVILCDPPLAEAASDPRYRPLREALAADIVTLHVPLEGGGRHPTRRMADRAFFARLGRGKGFLNSSRGAIVDEGALREAIRGGGLSFAALDVWEGEPAISPETVSLVDLATPHVAGYSFEGKVNGTAQVYAAACRYLGEAPRWDPRSVLGQSKGVTLEPTGDLLADLRTAVRTGLDVRLDDRALRGIVRGPDPAAGFDALRRDYRKRREFSRSVVRLARPDRALSAALKGLGFGV